MANLLARTEKKQRDWLTISTDVITTQSHSLFACSCEKISKWKTAFEAKVFSLFM
jgi:hypothetical protein